MLLGVAKAELPHVPHDEQHGPLEVTEDGGGAQGPVEAPVPQPRPQSVHLRQVQEVVELPGPRPKGHVVAVEHLGRHVQELGKLSGKVIRHSRSSRANRMT